MTAAGATLGLSVLGFGVRSLACVAVVLWALPLATLVRWLVGLALIATAMMVFATRFATNHVILAGTWNGLALVTMAVREVALGGVLGLAIAAPVFALQLGGALWPMARVRQDGGIVAWWHYAVGLAFASAQGFGLLLAALLASATAHPVGPLVEITTPIWLLSGLVPATLAPAADVVVAFEVWAAVRAAPGLVFDLWRLAMPVALPLLVVAVAWQAAAAVAARVTAQGTIAPWAEAAVSLVAVLVLAAITPTLWAYVAATLVTPLL